MPDADETTALLAACREELRIGPHVGEPDVCRRAALRQRIDSLIGPEHAAAPVDRLLSPPAAEEAAKPCSAVRSRLGESSPFRCISTAGHDGAHYDAALDVLWTAERDWPADYDHAEVPEAERTPEGQARRFVEGVREREHASKVAGEGAGRAGVPAGPPSSSRGCVGTPSPPLVVGPSRTTDDGSANGRPDPRPSRCAGGVAVSRHPTNADASPAVLFAFAASCAAIAYFVPGWRLACGLGAILLAAVALVDLWFARRPRRPRRPRPLRVLVADALARRDRRAA